MRSKIKRALLYGFNDTTSMYMSESSSYDVFNISNFLVQKCQFDPKNIRIISKFTKKSQNKNDIEENLFWLIKGCIPGDVLFFYYSGLGFCNPKDQGNPKDQDILQGICCVDRGFNFISDEWFYDSILLKIPDNVTFWGFMDCCHKKINKLRFNIEYNLDKCVKKYLKLKYNEDYNEYDITDDIPDDIPDNKKYLLEESIRQINIASREAVISGYFQDEDQDIIKQKSKQTIIVQQKNDQESEYDRFVETSNHEAVLSGYFDDIDEFENESDLDDSKDDSKDALKEDYKNKYEYEYNDRYNDNYWINNYIINVDQKKQKYPYGVYLFTGYLDFEKIDYTIIMDVNKLQGSMTRVFLKLLEKEYVTELDGTISFKSNSLTVNNVLKQLNYRLYLGNYKQRVVLSCNNLDIDKLFNI